MIKIPFFHQETGYTCGPASMKMVFDFFGLKISEKELKKKLKSNKEVGTNHEYLIKTAVKNGFYCYVHKNATINQIKDFLDEGLPVIVHYMEPSSDEEHYSVIVEIKGRKIIMNDPWNGKRFKLSEKDFTGRWHGKSRRGWLMVLSKKNFDLGKQYNP